MESFLTELNLEGESYPVLKCHYQFTQSTDATGQPNARARSGLIELYFADVEDDQLANWAINPQKKMNGKICFYRPGQSAVFKELQFEDAYCVEYKEQFRASGGDNPGGVAYVCFLGITAARLQIGGVKHDNGW